MNLSRTGLGKVAGLGGIALGVVVLLLRPVIEQSASLPEATRGWLLLTIAIGAFVIGALGMTLWVLGGRAGGRWRYSPAVVRWVPPPSEMPEGAIFISYAREDLAAVRALKNSLEAAGLSVWFDSDRIAAGDSFDNKIHDNIQRCSLFLPVLSQNTEARTGGFFRREWRYALDREMGIAPDVPFVIPVAIDDTTHFDTLPLRFRELHITALTQGQVTQEFVERLKRVKPDVEPVTRRFYKPDVEPVDAAVFCPARVKTGSTFLVQVCLYQPADAAEAEMQSREADPQAVRRGTYSLPLDIPHETHVDIRLEMKDLEIAEPDAVVVWRGGITSAQFEVVVPATKLGNTIGRVRFAVSGIPAGTLRFMVEVVAQHATAKPTWCKANAVRYHYAFASYSSKDRAEVLRRVQAFRIAGLSVFQDMLELEPGERWEPALYSEIDRCDVFLLFWSRAAAASERVAKEIDYALKRTGRDYERPPAIQPVPIEGPPPVPPPAALKHLHFNDALLAHIKAASAQNLLH